MRKLKAFFLLLSLVTILTRCASRSVDDETFSDESGTETADNLTNQSEEDPFAESGSLDSENPEKNTPSMSENENQNSENDLGDEIALDEEDQKDQKEKPVEVAQQESQVEPAKEPEAEQVQPIIEEPTQDFVQEPPPVALPEPSVQSMNLENKVTGIKLIPNETGGAFVIETERPATYTSRFNQKTNQFIVEVENVILPEQYRRPIISKDVEGTFGALDAYQSPGSNQARFVIQLKAGVAQPSIQAEGPSLIVAATGSSPMSPRTEMVSRDETTDLNKLNENMPLEQSVPLSSASLNEFLANNNRFYGKTISIQTESMDIRDALHFITEESGLNMIIAEEVSGSVSLKLREVPWDQALVLLMKTKKLGYSRQGNVLRIAPLADLKLEEDEANRLAQAKQTIEPLFVKMFQISYAKIEDMSKNIKEFLSPRGKLIGDFRTNSIVVTDIPEHLDRIAKLVEKLDTVPLQVLIEGKIVEATERFSRDLGVNWSSSGQLVKGSGINMQPSFDVSPEAKTSGAFIGHLNVGVLDLLGTISSTLALSEKENKVKVISSPRILTLSNEKANIEQISQEPSRSVSNANGVQAVSYTFVDLPLKMEVTPQVTTDSSIIMQLDVERTFKGDTVGTGNDEKFSVNKRKISTKVLVRNGQTAVIGGIYKSDNSEGQTGVPYLRNIPFIGFLFRSDVSSSDKSELIIFLTPRIVGQALSKKEGDSSSVSY